MKAMFALLFFVCFTNLYLSASSLAIPTSNNGDNPDTENDSNNGVISFARELLESFSIDGIIPPSGGIKNYLQVVIQELNNLVETFGSVTKDNVEQSAKELYGRVKDEKIVKQAVTAILNVYNGIKDNISKVDEETRDTAVKIVKDVKDGVVQLKQPALDLAARVIKDIKTNVDEIKEPTQEKVGEVIKDFQETLSSYQDPAKEKIKDLINDVSSVLSAILQGPLKIEQNAITADS